MTTFWSPDEVIADLNSLIQLEYDAIAAYQAAIERLESERYKETFREFLGDHKSHVTNLTNLVIGEGGTPEDGGDMKKVLTKGKVVLADIAGDEAILKAMNSNEKQTNKKYEKSVENDYPPNIKVELQKGLSDERRHKAWIEAALEEF